MKPSKPFTLGNTMSNEDIKILQSRLDIAYAEITNQLLSHIFKVREITLVKRRERSSLTIY